MRKFHAMNLVIAGILIVLLCIEEQFVGEKRFNAAFLCTAASLAVAFLFGYAAWRKGKKIATALEAAAFAAAAFSFVGLGMSHDARAVEEWGAAAMFVSLPLVLIAFTSSLVMATITLLLSEDKEPA